MPQEVIGVKVKRRIIVCHRSTQIILVETGKSSVDVIGGLLGLQMDGFGEIFLALLPFLARKTDNGTLAPEIAVIRVNLQTFIECSDSFGSIFLQDKHFCLHGIGRGMLAPTRENGIQLQKCRIIVFLLNMTEHPVMPKALILRVVAQGLVVIADSLRIFLLLDSAEPPEFIHRHHKRIALDGFRTICLCACEIIEIIFGYATVEPWLIEIRLG